MKSTPFILIAALVMSCFIFNSCKKDKGVPTALANNKVLTLIPATSDGITGTATIAENEDHSFNILIKVSNAVEDSTVFVDIHNGRFEDPFGKQAIDLGSVKVINGSITIDKKNLSHITLPDLSRTYISYDSILTYKGFINLSYVEKPHNVSTTIAHFDLNSEKR